VLFNVTLVQRNAQLWKITTYRNNKAEIRHMEVSKQLKQTLYGLFLVPHCSWFSESKQ